MTELMLPVIGEKDPVRITEAIHQLAEIADTFALSATQIISGTGLTGGGTLAADRTLNVVAGTGLVANANDVALSFLGLQTLTDPNADRILFWEDSAGSFAWLVASTGLTITTTNLTASSTFTDTFSVLIETVANQDYKIVVKCPFGGTIVNTTSICVSGTATATFKINTTALGGTANAVSSAEQTQAQASNNVFVAGDDIVITMSANASCLRASLTVEFTRSL